MKKILHFKVPMTKDDKLALTPEETSKIATNLKNRVAKVMGEDYVVMVSPFDVSLSDAEGELLNFDAKQLSVEEFINLIGGSI